MILAEVTINCIYCCCGCCCWLCCSTLLSAAAQPHQLFSNLWLHLLMYVLGLMHAPHTGVTIPSLLSRPSRRVVSALTLPTFTAAVAGPQLNLPSTSSLAPSSSSTASALTTTAISQPITSPPLLPPSAPQLPSCLSCQIPTLPKKLTETILAGEYIDLSDLLPEQLRINTPSHSSSTKEVVIIPESSWDTRRWKKRQITDIATWVEVFSTYILVLSTQFPEYLPELVAYQLSIVKLSKRFRYPSWLFYDVEYRKWAAANRIKTWSKTNSELFALAFTGQAVGITWCPVCQVKGGDHMYDCPRYPSQTPPQYINRSNNRCTEVSRASWSPLQSGVHQHTVSCTTKMQVHAHMELRADSYMSAPTASAPTRLRTVQASPPAARELTSCSPHYSRQLSPSPTCLIC